MTIYMMWASAAWLIMTGGYILRAKREWHIPFMLTAIMMDIALVLLLQVQRSAIGKAISFELGLLPQLHILFSTLALVLYFPMMGWGYRLRNGTATPNQRRYHLRTGYWTYIFRTLGFMLMFSLIGKQV